MHSDGSIEPPQKTVRLVREDVETKALEIIRESKSLVIGWDARWGEVRQVTAAGSSTTGTYRPYGLDCSGFVDWVFYNQSGGSYVIGHGRRPPLKQIL